MAFFKYLFIFCLFSVIGWILEFCYRSIITKKIVNPGFMSGCVVPLYGFGVLILTFICNLFNPIDSNYKVIIIFIVSIVLLTFLEFITGFILLKFFHLKLWDYSNRKFNYNGLICLEFSFIWGMLSLIFYYLCYSWINSFATNFVNNNIGLFFLGIFVGIFIIDLCVSIQLLNRLTKYADSVKQIVNVEKIKLDSRMKTTKKKFLNTIYPYISTNRFIRDKIKDSKGSNLNEKNPKK